MQDAFDIKLVTFNVKSHLDVDVIIDENSAILLCFFNEHTDFKQNFYKISKASLKFQKLHIIFENCELKFI